MTAQAGGQADELVVGGVASLHLDRALLYHHPGVDAAPAHIEASAGDGDLAAPRLHHKGPAAVVFDAEQRLAFAQLNGTTILFKAHLDPAATVQIDRRTIGQGHQATLAQCRGKLGRVGRRWLQDTEQPQADGHRHHTGGHRVAHQRALPGATRRWLAQRLQTRRRHQVGRCPQALEPFEFVAVLRVLVQPAVESAIHLDIDRGLLQTHKPLRRFIANRCLPARTITSIHHGSSCLSGDGNTLQFMDTVHPGGRADAAACGSYTFPPCSWTVPGVRRFQPGSGLRFSARQTPCGS
ncbi:hypothetical protein D3C76_938720 [compost metagenome]